MKSFVSVWCLFCVLTTATTVVWATSVQDGCCFPPQFVAGIGQTNGLVLPTGKGLAQSNYIACAFDFTNNRVGEEIYSTSMGKTTYIKVIINYKENYMYTIIGQTCTKSAAMGEFLPCIPKTAQSIGSYYFGDKQLSLDGYNYYSHAPGVFEGNATISVTKGGCIPVGTVLIGTTLQTPPLPIISTSGYLNYTEGISDPGRWFNIPDICKKDSSKESKRSVDSDPILQLVSQVNMLLLPIR